MSHGQLAAAQQPDWPDVDLLDDVRNVLRSRPPLVSAAEIVMLSEALADVGRRDALILQGGDCAELFSDASGPVVRRKLGQLYGLAEVLKVSLRLPVVALGRIAGQYAKPRSVLVEALHDDNEVPAYRGDAVNHVEGTAEHRVPDPRRLLTAYDRAADTLAAVRETWVGRSPADRAYATHELLLLDYEVPLSREMGVGWYETSCHSGWIGERTRSLDGAHVGLAGTIENPVGVKLGPSIGPDEAVELSRKLNPHGRSGHLTFIVRMGADRIDDVLGDVVSAVARDGAPVVWLSDPMHGNTVRTRHGVKTRSLQAVKRELASFVRIVREHHQWPGGLHLEMTPDDVTECVPDDNAVQALLPRYRTALDPRLNPAQAAEVVHHFVALL